MPEPRFRETRDEFMARCMSSEEARKDFPDQARRAAFCSTQWRKSGGKGLRRKTK